MGNPQTVPMFAPDGTLGDIPYEKMAAAKQAGFTLGVTMKSADGQTGVVPSNRVQDAAKGGLTIVPFQEQEAQHPGFWQSAYEDLVGLGKASLKMSAGLGVGPGADNSVDINGSAIRAMTPQQKADYIKNGPATADEQRKAAGYSTPYRVAAPIAQGLGVNVPGMEESAREGDVAGVAGHTIAVPAAMAAGAGVKAAAPAVADTAGAAVSSVKHGLSKLGSAATSVGQSLDPDIVGLVSPRAAHALRLANKIGKVATKLGGSTAADTASDVPAEAPAPLDLGKELGSLRQTGAQAASQTGEALSTLRQNAAGPKPYVEAEPQQTSEPQQTPVDTSEPTPPSERTLSGESALRKILTGQDNANLLKIAKSRGINVTQESQLKPGVADNRLVNKIVDDFSPDELDEMSARYLESTRFRHDFQDIGPEAWKTLSLQTYFPDLKLPQALINRTHAAILKGAANRMETTAPAAAPEEDLTGILQESLKQAQAKKGPQAVQ